MLGHIQRLAEYARQGKKRMKTKNYDCPLLKGKDKTKKRLVKFWDDGIPKETMMNEADDFCLNHCPRRECFEVIHDRKERQKLTKVECGRLGGRATATKYEHDVLVEWGRKGGQTYALNLRAITSGKS